MPIEIKNEIQLEIAHVLFIDIVGYSKLSISDQHARVEELNRIVRASQEFQRAEAASRLTSIPTGDGMALAFYTSPEAPAQCAVEIRDRAETPGPRALGGDGSSVAGAGGSRCWDRNVFPLSRAINAGCAGKKHRGASV